MKPGDIISVNAELASFISISTDEETGISTMKFILKETIPEPKPEDYNWMLEAYRKNKK